MKLSFEELKRIYLSLKVIEGITYILLLLAVIMLSNNWLFYLISILLIIMIGIISPIINSIDKSINDSIK